MRQLFTSLLILSSIIAHTAAFRNIAFQSGCYDTFQTTKSNLLEVNKIGKARTTHANLLIMSSGSEDISISDRRSFLTKIASAALMPLVYTGTNMESAKADDDELPEEVIKIYEQNRRQLQLSADYFAFELLDLVLDPLQWPKIADLYGRQPSKLERVFLNTMRVLTSTFPPEYYGDELREAQIGFEQAMAKLNKQTRGFAVDDRIGVDLTAAVDRWDGARVHLNAFMDTLNTALGGKSRKLVTVPPLQPNPKYGAAVAASAATAKAGPSTSPNGYVAEAFAPYLPITTSYPRSKDRYLELQRNLAQCQNRGGQTFANIWGGLMVYGTAVNPCGNVNLDNYFD